ncbi:MAG TPA: T9SS type A sorting domain-containing protein [Saprospiraceae bacterium]|nr:T9SS type A sorting domain-containing protein [Saprospiraceae bacterium]HMP26144.1 T9SS type A sorting domain-containing protein [Saprospiraceae bacterium]
MKKWLCYLIVSWFWIASLPIVSGQNAVLTNPSACGLNLPITDNNCPENAVFFDPDLFAINVNNAPGTRLGTDVYLKEVRLLIQHTWAGDLDISLRSPGGKTIRLSFDNGGGGNNYGDFGPGGCSGYMTLSVAACQSIKDGTAPFLDGTYAPEESFFLFNDGVTNPNGQWILQICDDLPEDTGTLEYVQLVFESLSCLPISNVQVLNVDTTTVRLTWAPDDCSPYIVEYGPPGFTPGIDQNPGPQGAVAFANFCAPYNLQGLQPDTEYEVYVRRRCVIQNSFSENSCPVRVRTSCLPPPQTIVERFDSYPLCATTCGAVCDFPGIWRNVSGDSFDWLVNQGSTPTPGTGPAGDVNGGSGRYVYLEASGAACTNGREGYLVSNCIRINKQGADTCHLSFNYHMFGTNIGTLRLQFSRNGGATWQTMWQRAGNQGNQWRKEYLSLNNFDDGEVVRFRFVGVGGNGFLGDIAIDNIVFFGSEDLGWPDTPLYVDADGDGYGNDNNFILTCIDEVPPGYSLIGGDCNDNDPNINPGAMEIPCDGIDNNCSGSDDTALPPPLVSNDTICSGGVAVICATPATNRPIFWYTSPDGDDIVGVGTCFFPELPLNNSPVPVIYRFYALETDFTCSSTTRSEAIVVVYPNPALGLPPLPEICPGTAFDLGSLVIEDANFTGADFTFHAASPTNSSNLLPSTIVTPTATTTYFVRAETPNGCFAERSVTVFARPAPQLSFTPARSFSLCLENAERVSVTAVGGSGSYTYLWSTGDTNRDIDIRSGAIAGTVDKYFVTVTDGGACVATDSVLVTSSNSIDSIRVATTDVSACTGNDGRITVTPLSGQGPFRYEWSSANGVNGSILGVPGAHTINNLPQGAYRITITDSSPQACAFFVRQVVVNGPAAMVRTPVVTNVSCAGAMNGRIDLNVTGVNPQFLWNTGATTASLQNIQGGNYSVTITDGACETILEDIAVSEPNPLTIVDSRIAPSCADSNNGSIDLTVFGGTGSYNFLWNNGSRREDLTDLSNGVYTVTVTDARGCEQVRTFSLMAPAPLAITVDSLRSISCFNASDGYLQVQAAGGTAPYRYVWNTGSTAPVLSNLLANTYTVTLTDFNGCQQILPVAVEQPALLQLGIEEQVNPQCIGDDTGLLRASATGGTAPYTFNWNTGATGATLANLEVGNYTLTLTDANGCPGGLAEVALTATSPIDVLVTTTAPDCIGRSDGRISLQPIGTGPFTFSWSRGDVSQNLDNVTIGAYAVTVSDNEGCLYDTTIVVDAAQAFDLNLAIFQPSCAQSTDGEIDVNFFRAGTPPVQFNWNNGSTSQSLSGLSTGDYVLSLTDSRGCTFTSDTIRLQNPAPLALQVDAIGPIVCRGDSTGFIELNVSGGVGPYTYNWVGTGETTKDLFGIPAGDYRLVVLDANQCPIDTLFRLTEPPLLSTEVIINTSSECDAEFSNEIVAVVQGGIAPYRYFWSVGGEGDSTLSNLLPGEYQLLVQDANACLDFVPSIKVREAGAALVIDTFMVKDITCFDDNDGAITVRVSGGTAPFRFHFSNNTIITSNEREVTINGLAAGSGYNVTITDTGSGCVVVSERKPVNRPLPLSFIFDRISPPNCFSGSNGSIFASTYGGIPPYNYQWYNAANVLVGTREDLTGAANSVYRGVVTDARGCRDTTEAIVLQNDNEPIRFANPPVVTPVQCKGEATGAINVTIQGGKKPYLYQWSNNRRTEDIANLAAGAYTLTLTDADTCRVIFPSIIVPEPATGITVNGKANDVLCYDEATGSIEVLVTGGKKPYSFLWEYRSNVFREDTSNLTGLRGGNYLLTVRDSNQCLKTATFEVQEPPALEVLVRLDDSGIIRADVSGGTPGYSFSWSTGENVQQITPNGDGTYRVTVTDTNNCEATGELVLVGTSAAMLGAKVQLYPNPGGGLFWLDLRLPRVAEVRIEVWNIQGQRIVAERPGMGQTWLLPIDLRPWSPGLYWLSVYADEQRIHVGQLLLQK